MFLKAMFSLKKQWNAGVRTFENYWYRYYLAQVII